VFINVSVEHRRLYNVKEKDTKVLLITQQCKPDLHSVQTQTWKWKK